MVKVGTSCNKVLIKLTAFMGASELSRSLLRAQAAGCQPLSSQFSVAEQSLGFSLLIDFPGVWVLPVLG